MKLQVTTLEELEAIQKTEVVKVGEFYDGTMLIAEVQRPYLLDLLSGGKIPNTLLTTAMTMFKSGSGAVVSQGTEDLDSLKQMSGLMELLADACLVNPSHEQIKSKGLRLTEGQYMAIMSYTQGGVKMLENFHQNAAGNKGTEPEQDVPENAESNPED